MTREADPGLLWELFELPQMWDMVKDEDAVPTYQQVGAWQKMAALCTDEADVLQKALDQLMAGWPPNPGSAAEAFKGHVDLLIWSMRDSAAAAAANVAPLIEIVMALGQAKDEIGVLMQRYNTFQKQEDDGVVPTPPVGWRDALDHQARTVMALTDTKVGQAAAQIKSPEPYVFEPDGRRRVGTEPPGGSIDDGRHPKSIVLAPGKDLPGPAERAFPEGESDVSDSVLDGAQLPLGLVSHEPGINPGGSLVHTPAGVALAPGGVIAAPFASGTARSGASGPASEGGRSGAGNGPMMVSPPIGHNARGSGAGRDAVTSGGRRRRRSDPEDPWAPPAGVPPVLEARADPDYFDPGPNVIGIDR
jgi:hypothetical protein